MAAVNRSTDCLRRIRWKPARYPHRLTRYSERQSNVMLDTGVRAINALLTVGRGQRMGLFAGGVGKSVLLGMMARATRADVLSWDLSANVAAKLKILSKIFSAFPTVARVRW